MIAVGVVALDPILTSWGNSTPSATGRETPTSTGGTGASTGGTAASTGVPEPPPGVPAPPPREWRRQLVTHSSSSSLTTLFTGTSLDSSKWNTYLGAQGTRWDNHGFLPAPYSGPNTPLVNNEAMFGPSEVSVNNGLTLTATPNTNQYSSI